jgi:hypothetical protein
VAPDANGTVSRERRDAGPSRVAEVPAGRAFFRAADRLAEQPRRSAKRVPDYSYLSASIGSSRDARIAGKMPKKMPTTAEKLMPRAKDHQGRKTGKPVK